MCLLLHKLIHRVEKESSSITIMRQENSLDQLEKNNIRKQNYIIFLFP